MRKNSSSTIYICKISQQDRPLVIIWKVTSAQTVCQASLQLLLISHFVHIADKWYIQKVI